MRSSRWICSLLLAAACSGELPDENACGGPAPLEGTPGHPCGTCGTWRCNGPDSIVCDEGPVNECGGCATLAGVVGASCGRCGLGRLECGGRDSFSCAGADVGNGCGGCASLPARPGDPCNDCGGTWQCRAPDSLVCDGSMATRNRCGGCEPLVADPGEPCERCGAYVCDGEDAVRCESDGCPIGGRCAASEECAEGHCSNGRCVPGGWTFAPAATFVMGAPLDEPGRHLLRENGQHTVVLTRSLLVKHTTVTQGEWFDVTGTRPSFFDACGDDCPVDSISWWEMLVYADLLSRREGLEECYGLTDCTGTLGQGCAPGLDRCTGFGCATIPTAALDCLGYRLATEAEWEYVARAGTMTAFLTRSGTIAQWGSSPLDTELDEIAWYGGNSGVTYAGGIDCSSWSPSATLCGTHPVGRKLPNAWGLHDMTGNVWERVYDWSGDYPPAGSTVVDPTGPVSGTSRRMRGGPFDAWGQYMRVAYRTGPIAEARFYNIGFRVVRTFPVE